MHFVTGMEWENTRKQTRGAVRGLDDWEHHYHRRKSRFCAICIEYDAKNRPECEWNLRKPEVYNPVLHNRFGLACWRMAEQFTTGPFLVEQSAPEWIRPWDFYNYPDYAQRVLEFLGSTPQGFKKPFTGGLHVDRNEAPQAFALLASYAHHLYCQHVVFFSLSQPMFIWFEGWYLSAVVGVRSEEQLNEIGAWFVERGYRVRRI